MATVPSSSGVYVNDVDLYQIIASTSTSVGAIAGATSKGPVDKPYLITNTKAYVDRFGIPNSALSWVGYQAIAFLQESGALYVQRVAGVGSTYGGLLLTKPTASQFTITTPLIQSDPTSVDFTTVGGYSVNENMAYFSYEGPGSFSGNLALGIDSLNLPSPSVPILAQAASGGTLGAATYSYRVTAFNSLGETLASTAATVVVASGTTNTVTVTWAPVTGAQGYKVYGRTSGSEGLLYIAGSAGYTYTDTGATTPAGTVPANYTIALPVPSPSTVATTGGQLLGGQTYTYRVTAVTAAGESGVSQQIQVPVASGTSTNAVTLNWAAVAGATGYNIYGRTESIGATNFNLVTAAGVSTTIGSPNLTSAALFVNVAKGMAISGAGIPAGATVLSVTSSSAITISANATATSATVSCTFTGTSSIATGGYIAHTASLTYTDTGALNPGYGTPVVNGHTTQFTVKVYDLTISSTNPQETYLCSMSQELDAFGQQLEIEQRINTTSTRIRVHSNAAAMASIPLVYSVPTTTFATGADGAAVTNSQVAQAWTTAFNDREAITVRLLIDGGYCTPVVQLAMDAVAHNRQDCVAILSVPTASQSVSNALDYRNITLNLNSNRSTLYTPDVYIQDNYNNRPLYVPPSGHVAAIYARTDRVSYPWRAPAGMNRGLLSVLGLRYIYNQGARDLLAQAQINYLRNFPGNGIAVWEQMTLQGSLSAMSFVHVRRLFDNIRVAVENYLLYSEFEPNDNFLRSSIVGGINSYLQSIQNARGITQFLVVSDNTNNDPQSTGQGVLKVDIYLTPTLPASKIMVQLVATKEGVQLTQLANATGGNF